MKFWIAIPVLVFAFFAAGVTYGFRSGFESGISTELVAQAVIAIQMYEQLENGGEEVVIGYFDSVIDTGVDAYIYLYEQGHPYLSNLLVGYDPEQIEEYLDRIAVFRKRVPMKDKREHLEDALQADYVQRLARRNAELQHR